MSNIDKQALRNLAVAAKLAPSWYAVGEFGDVVDPAKPEWKPVHEFCKTFTAERVLALLDELEAKDKRIESALSLLSDVTTENVWEIIGRLNVVICGDYRSEDEIAAAAGKGE
ncbi:MULTISPECIES: ead/Ea22-like family protein [Enterobacter cloacae complex]|uniref:ead/Ea22-like family protein n=1 Tax=Enterobacter cloacae complex TaxID=354276 RepID=UPI000AD9E98E|nr:MULTISPECIES: ead/Ea22-like family protein [Enterobacter cloacae complex]MCH1622518.1 ead/Ea22-like family protein [Enterobacter hormaechei]MCH1632671.1 ead/Ea22-like family protein [Enterobacter hormaechei]MCO7370003.1 ead/Ea22-like family protein [Enterobacter hormaechei]MCO7380543.1 ead/Ea22-like family protein [Enterobacter hormaechei]MCO7386137.1 ead/Ea22-like family protein [Enterobacter hormaechei]